MCVAVITFGDSYVSDLVSVGKVGFEVWMLQDYGARVMD